MKLVTLEQLQLHCRTDGDDDELLTICGNSAEAAVLRLVNRNLYLTTADMDVAVAGIEAAMTAAYATYDAAVTSATAITNPARRSVALDRAETNLASATLSQDRILHGLVIATPTDAGEGFNSLSGSPADLIHAVLLIAGHLYRNREEVVSGQGSAAVQVPFAAQVICDGYRWIGPNV